MGNIDATLNIKLGELLDNQTELLNRFDLGLTQVENKKNQVLTTIENKKNQVVDELEAIISPNIGFIGNAGSLGFGVGNAPDILASQYGLVGLEGFQNPISQNYGNYFHIKSGSIMVYIPKHYVKYTNETIEPYLGTRIDVSHTQLAGYKLPRVFINNGFVIDGIFVDKYKGGIVENMFVSRRGLNPASTHTDHNPISQCTANGKTPTNTYGGMYDAVKSRGNDFVLMSVFLATMMADLADAHYQACFRNNNFESCAWAKVAPYQPKGCNNNALGDTNDSSVVYKSSGHSNCGLTGGVTDTILAKTTHNGQSCGVADVNGLMWEVASGFIRTTANGFLVFKDTVDIRIITDDGTGATGAYNIAHYDPINLSAVIGAQNAWTYFGNANNQVFGFSTDKNTATYKQTSIGIPLAAGIGGTVEFGNDGLYRHLVDQLAVIVGGDWIHTSTAGVFCMGLGNVRSYSPDFVGGRASFLVQE